MLAGEAPPPGIAKQSATTKPELAESSGGVGLCWSRADGMNSAAATAAVKVEARPPRFVKSASRQNPNPNSDESLAEPGCARPSRKETVEAAKMVPRERVQQWSAEQLWDVLQFWEWLVKEMKENERRYRSEVISFCLEDWASTRRSAEETRLMCLTTCPHGINERDEL